MSTPNATYLQETIESQKRIIVALQNEIHWLKDVIFNPSYNEVDMRIIVNRTPPEMRWGLSNEVPEKKLYLPDEAEKVHASPKTITKRLKMLEKAGAVAYRTAPDPETGNSRSYLKVLPALEQPAQITVERPQRGGSTWQDGKRLKRCKDCGSEHLIEVTKREIVCEECGSLQSPTRETRKLVNTPCPTPYSQDDCGTSEEQPASVEIPKLPRITESTLAVSTEDVEPPLELRSRKIWVCWRYEKNDKGKLTKVPYVAAMSRSRRKAKSNDESTWRTYEQAKEHYERSRREGWKDHYDGIGFMCDGSFTVIDYDHRVIDHMIDAPLLAQIRAINSYGELSPSETGIHQIAFGTIPSAIKRSEIEMYCTGRFLTWTGKHLVGTPTTIENSQEQIAELHAAFAHPMPIKSTREEEKHDHPPCGHDGRAYSDEEILLRARNARNGAKFERLWEGNTNGYASQSEADQALCNILAWWTSDAVAIDRLFRQSKLMREKWDRAARQGETYGEGTIRRAIGLQKEQIA